MSFSDDLKRFAKKTIGKEKGIRRMAAIDVFSAIITSTPVDKGVLINNWFATIGRPSNEETHDPGAAQIVIGRLSQDIPKDPKYATIFLTNNLPYAAPIEFDGHSSYKAPQGMVRINVARWDDIVKRLAQGAANE